MMTPSLGLPSPPPRSPATPSRAFPHTIVPRLPKVGTAKLRLRSNVIGLFAYILVWWQGAIYGSAKHSAIWLAGGVIGDSKVNSAIGFAENVLLFVLAWNIVEATYVIYRTPLPSGQPTAPSSISARPFRPSRSLASSLRGLSSSVSYMLVAKKPATYADNATRRYLSLVAQDSPLGISNGTPDFLDSSSTFSTPTRVNNGSVSSLRYFRMPSSPASNPLASRSMNFLDHSMDSSSGGYNTSPLSSYLGRHDLPPSGRALDGRALERLLDSSE